jgi:hypothetical protein
MKIQKRSKILISFLHNLHVKNVRKPFVGQKVKFHEFLTSVRAEGDRSAFVPSCTRERDFGNSTISAGW